MLQADTFVTQRPIGDGFSNQIGHAHVDKALQSTCAPSTYRVETTASTATDGFRGSSRGRFDHRLVAANGQSLYRNNPR
jgi:hypothetical protein